MAFYSIGEIAERCGINPVTLRAWQRRYGLLKPQRSEGGHRQFDEDDIQRIEEIKRWIKSGVPVGKVKALLDKDVVVAPEAWNVVQEEMMGVVRQARPATLRAKITALVRENAVDGLIDNVFLPVRRRLSLDKYTAPSMRSLMDGALIEYATLFLAEARKKTTKEALLMGWGKVDRARLWLEACRLAQQGWHIDLLAEPLDLPHPELFPNQHFFVWTDEPLNAEQQERAAHWKAQGFAITFLTDSKPE
ncbi:MerR family transcriptional regulator [Cronobacter malonaticus]|nr:MerR family transcriptional regulator [Cronobacter malonaticus]